MKTVKALVRGIAKWSFWGVFVCLSGIGLATVLGGSSAVSSVLAEPTPSPVAAIRLAYCVGAMAKTTTEWELKTHIEGLEIHVKYLKLSPSDLEEVDRLIAHARATNAEFGEGDKRFVESIRDISFGRKQTPQKEMSDDAVPIAKALFTSP